MQGSVLPEMETTERSAALQRCVVIDAIGHRLTMEPGIVWWPIATFFLASTVFREPTSSAPNAKRALIDISHSARRALPPTD